MAEPRPKRETRYEYKTVGWETKRLTMEDSGERINNEAVDGWEFFETIEVNGTTTQFVFRRRE